MKKLELARSVGVIPAVLSALLAALFSLIPVLAEEGNQTSTSSLNVYIDPAPFINLIVALLPVILVIIIIKSLFESLGRFARFSKIRSFFSRFTLPKLDLVNVARIAGLIALLFLGVGFAGVFAQESGSSSLNIDISQLVGIVIQLMPLIIILVVMRAIMDAFKGLHAFVPLLPVALVSAGSQVAIDVSAIVNIVLAILPIFIILWVVKVVLESFSRLS